MLYELQFLPSALKEWKKLDGAIREQLKNKLKERLKHPKVPSAKLRNLKDHYKIKLRTVGYRLVYRVDDKKIIVTVVVINKRDKNIAYKIAAQRSQV
ncbi:MAG: type II toxin-antitoxin system RelE/ParE family toxin [Gammaproteobacteria bacterium]